MSPRLSIKLLLAAATYACIALGSDGRAQAPAGSSPAVETATFAGGCFWCVEADFDKIAGVVSTTSGYMGGHLAKPTYAQVSAGRSGHVEVVQVQFDPRVVSYAQLVEYFWRTVDPTVKDAQFCDRGSQYRTAIFFHGDAQRRVAEASKAALAASKPFRADLVTEITPAATFYVADDEHQDYYTANPVRYAYYRRGCGRDQRLKFLWGEQASKPAAPAGAPAARLIAP
ncbi:MAG: peptide-methionine (S)-S-oxide reductase MsrA [Betaproteobacteria bacterium]